MIRYTLILVPMFVAVAGCSKDGAGLHPVRGSVRVNGQPAERVVVSFHHIDPSVKGNAAHPCTVTDATGAFQMSTNKDGDGAVEGEYLVTFVWWSHPDPDLAKDLLGGVYSDPKKSAIRVTISGGSTAELQPFDLKADERQARQFVK
jgi:hypothetical protein